MSRALRATSVAFACLIGAALTIAALSESAVALPTYAITSASQCDTCHIEPLGWANPDISERRCSLDCTSCHVSPAGGGMRTPAGQYYGRQVLPIWGDRPGSHADPEKYRPKGYPKEGRYALGEGFTGWWAGKIRHTDIAERYGDIDPDPKWDFGADFRAALLDVSGDEVDRTYTFPMQADLYLLNESVEDLTLYVSGGLQGQTDTDRYDDLEADEYLTIRELFLQQELPYNSWILAGRFVPRYGWRTADHTAFTRDDLGFDQFFQAFGVSGGYNPQYLYADASAYYQGLAAWPGERLPRGAGTTLNAGYRALGWQTGASFAYTDLKNDTVTITAGLNWALNLDPLAYYGEIDLRRVAPPGAELEPFTGLYALHVLRYRVIRGVSGKVQYDWGDRDLNMAEDHKHRITLGLNVYPIAHLDLELDYRLNYRAVNPLSSPADTIDQELLLMTHVWF